MTNHALTNSSTTVASERPSWTMELRRLGRNPRFLGFYAITLCIGVAMSFIMPFISLWAQREVGLSTFEFGAYLVASTSSGIALAFLFGKLSDAYIQRRTALAVACACGALGYGGFALAVSPASLVAVGVTLTAAASVCFAQVFAATREWFASMARPAVTVSVVRIGFSVAGIVGAPVGATIATRFGFTGLFLATSALYIVAFLGVLILLPRQSQAISRVSVVVPSLRVALCDVAVVRCFGALTLTFGAFSAATINLPLLLDDAFGGSLLEIGFVFSISPFVEVPLMLWFGSIAARTGTRRLMRLGGLMSVLYFASLAASTELWHVCIAQVMCGIAYAILSNVAIVNLQDLMPAQPGLATAVFANSGSAGKILGYIGFGVLGQLLGTTGVFPACIASAAIGCALLFRLNGVDGRIDNQRATLLKAEGCAAPAATGG